MICLKKLLETCSDGSGLPVMNTSMFLETIDKYGKEEFRKALADHITEHKPPYPLHEFDQEKVVKTFHKLKKADWVDYIMTSNKEVIEKYDDYKYPYSKYGLGVIDGPSTYNYISDSFMNDLRLSCFGTRNEPTFQ